MAAAVSGPRTGIAAVLFTDVVGSTALRSSLGEEAAEALQATHDRLLADAVAGHRGVVVKGLGDGIMATFDSAADAVAAAVAIQQTIELVQRRSPGCSVLVRIGVSVGDVTFGTGDCHGTTVIEAARLCEAASGGQILVADAVRIAARGRGGHRFALAGALSLKGLGEPVVASAVEWDPLPGGGSVPLPPLLVGAVEPSFSGRDEPLAALQEAWDGAVNGRFGTVFITGEPGVGKTRLAAELARRVHRAGALVLYGHSDDELNVPYQPFVEALRHFVAHAPGFDVRGHLGRHAGDLIRLAPDIGERVSGLPPPLKSDAETERFRLFEAVASWLGAASRDEPILLVLDDLHWAERASVLLLRHLVRAAPPARVLVVGTYRDTELGRTHPLADALADLRRGGMVRRLALRGLDVAAVGSLLAGTLGHELGPDHERVALALHAESEGNPFFVAEVLRHLVETGVIAQRDGHWTAVRPIERLGIPEGIKEAVGRRLGRLSAESNEALAAGAAVGSAFRLSVLARTLDRPQDRLVDALHEAVDARLLEETGVGAYRFAHALVRSTLYDELGVTRRVRLHRRIAEAIEAVDVDRIDAVLGDLAFHYRQAAAGGDAARAIEFATRAARQAAASLAHDQAAAYYEQALELASDPALRCELRILLGEAQRDAGDSSYRRTLLDAAADARDRGDADRLARAAIANTRGYGRALVSDDERVAMLEGALAATPPADSRIRAELLATLAIEAVYSSDRERRRSLCDEAVAMARRLHDAKTLASSLRARTRALLAPDTLSQRFADTAEVVSTAAALGDHREQIAASIDRFSVAIEVGDIDEADRNVEMLARLVEEAGLPADRWSLKRRQSLRALLAGSTDEAERLATEALELGRSSRQPDAGLLYSAQLGSIRMVQGRLAEIEPGLAAFLRGDANGVTRALVAFFYCDLGGFSQAQALLARDAANRFADIPYELGWLSAMTAYARVAVETGHSAAAEWLYERLMPWRTHIDCPGNTSNGCVSLYLGALARMARRFDAAGAHLDEALRAHERLRAPYWMAMTRVEQGRMLLERRRPGDREQARSMFEGALAPAAAMGFATVHRRATELLQQAA
jgi:class 3 adenylate cyclase/tetratricopeptide (TPR) repeat protein